MSRKKLTKKQKKLIRKILEENDLQRETDKTVANVKLALEITKREGQQARTDKYVAEELEKICSNSKKAPTD
jgi:hypothetical protein